MDKTIDKEPVQRWLQRCGEEVARVARAWGESDDGGNEALGETLWFWAHCEGARGQQVLAALWSKRQGGSWDEGAVLSVASGLCAWGQHRRDNECIEEARRLFWLCWREWESAAPQRVELSFWISLLELGSALLYIQPERAMHIVAARCVATLLNDYYDAEAKTFNLVLDSKVVDGTTADKATASSALKAVDALMNEAVRCGDGRLFDWGDAVARGLAARGDLDAEAGAMLRLVGVRSLRHRAAYWGAAWIDRELNISDTALAVRSTCLCLRELEQLAETGALCSGALRF